MLPDRDGCNRLLTSAGCGEDIVAHVQAVARLALAFCDRAPAAERRLVEAGALLHDIGRAFDHGTDHVPLGVTHLREAGVDERVVAIVARHMGAGIDETQRRILGWPEGTYVPQTLEERIVCHADNLTGGTTYRVLADVVAKLERQQLAAAVPMMRALHGKLSTELGIDPDELSRAMQRRG